MAAGARARYGAAMEELFRTFTFGVATATELAAGVIVAVAVLEAAARAAHLFLTRSARTPNVPDHPGHDAKEEVRLKLGRWLAVALEFLLAADILRTAVAPSWDEIGKLAAIAVLRTALNFFLQREIDSARRRHLRKAGAGTVDATPPA